MDILGTVLVFSGSVLFHWNLAKLHPALVGISFGAWLAVLGVALRYTGG